MMRLVSLAPPFAGRRFRDRYEIRHNPGLQRVLGKAIAHLRTEEEEMNHGKLAILALALSLAGATAADAAATTVSGSTALAGVVAPYSPLSSGDKKAVAALFGGKSNIAQARKIVLTADKIVCRTSNVDITARSCELTFKTVKRGLKGREANEIYATEIMAGVPPDGAAGSVFESLSKLSCTLDPKVIKETAGGGADCSFEPGN
jgi:hypothetical protein